MGFHINFTEAAVRFGPDGALSLLVTGKTEFDGFGVPTAHGEPVTVKDIFVAVAHEGTLTTVRSDDPEALPWRATLAEGASAFAAHMPVTLLGVAVLSDGPPFVWQNTLQIVSKTR